MSVQNIPAEIVVNAELWQKYRDASAKASAAKRDAEQLEKQLGLPDASALCKSLGLKPGDKGELVVLNGNRVPIGKVSVFFFPGCEMPEGWRKRVS